MFIAHLTCVNWRIGSGLPIFIPDLCLTFVTCGDQSQLVLIPGKWGSWSMYLARWLVAIGNCCSTFCATVAGCRMSVRHGQWLRCDQKCCRQYQTCLIFPRRAKSRATVARLLAIRRAQGGNRSQMTMIQHFLAVAGSRKQVLRQWDPSLWCLTLLSWFQFWSMCFSIESHKMNLWNCIRK